jgi:hypothetical protein
MLSARPAKEVIVRLPNQIGALSGVAKSVADKGINILAVSAWVEGDEGVIRLLTDDTVHAAEALKALSGNLHESNVVVTEVPHKPGMLRRITDRLAHDGIDIHHLYATAAATQDQCLVVFATDNNDRAIVRLNADAR